MIHINYTKDNRYNVHVISDTDAINVTCVCMMYTTIVVPYSCDQVSGTSRTGDSDAACQSRSYHRQRLDLGGSKVSDGAGIP